MYKLRPISSFTFMALVLSCTSAARGNTFTEAQHCRDKSSVDMKCFQQRLAKFEQFVLADDASWFEKSIVGNALVTYYDSNGVSSPSEKAIRHKVRIYSVAVQGLDSYWIRQMAECQDTDHPDGCLKMMGCPKETYIKIKNVLVSADTEEFKAEIKHFDKDIKSNC